MISPFANRNNEELTNMATDQIASLTDLVTAKEKGLALMNAGGNNSDNVLPVKLRMFTADKKKVNHNHSI